MNCDRRIHWISVALGVVLAIGVAVTAGAQTPPGAATGELYTPAKDAKDLRAVLFNWMWHMGMLKGTDERDMVGTLEYQGKGTIQVDGQPCTLSKFRASTNYQTFTQRIQYACTRANGQKASNIEVVSGLYAWNEDVARRGDRCDEGQGHSDAGDRAGSADPHLGQPAGRGRRPRWRERPRHSGWAPTRARCSRTVSTKWARRL